MHKSALRVASYPTEPGSKGGSNKGILIFGGDYTIKGDFKMLGSGSAANGLVVLLAAVGGIDSDTLAPGVTQPLQRVKGIRIEVHFPAMFAGNFMRGKVLPSPRPRVVSIVFVRFSHINPRAFV